MECNIKGGEGVEITGRILQPFCLVFLTLIFVSSHSFYVLSHASLIVRPRRLKCQQPHAKKQPRKCNSYSQCCAFRLTEL